MKAPYNNNTISAKKIKNFQDWGTKPTATMIAISGAPSPKRPWSTVDVLDGVRA